MQFVHATGQTCVLLHPSSTATLLLTHTYNPVPCHTRLHDTRSLLLLLPDTAAARATCISAPARPPPALTGSVTQSLCLLRPPPSLHQRPSTATAIHTQQSAVSHPPLAHRPPPTRSTSPTLISKPTSRPCPIVLAETMTTVHETSHDDNGLAGPGPNSPTPPPLHACLPHTHNGVAPRA